MEQVLIQRIGARLRQEREQQGLSLEQVATTTRISRTHLNNLEQGEVACLPEPIYVQGFINRYARCLNLDPGRLRQEASRTPEPTPTTTPEPNTNTSQSPQAPEPSPVQATASSPSRPAPTLHQAWLKGAIAAVALAGIGVAGWQQLSQHRPAPQAPAATAVKPVPAATTPVKPAVNPNQAEIRSSGPAWVAIVVDGQDLPDRLLQPDQPLKLTVKQTLRVRPGRPDLVTVQLGDRRQAPLGDITAIRWYEFAVQP